MQLMNFLSNVAKDTLLGYIVVTSVGEGNTTSEKKLNEFNCAELFALSNKNFKAYYKIGEYWYIVV